MNTLLPIANEIGRAVLHSVWEGAAISLVFAVVMLLLRNRAASSRYLVACATLCLMVILPIVTIALTPHQQNGFAGRAAMSVQNMPAAPIIQGEAAAPALVPYRVKLSLLQYVAAAWAVGFAVVSIWQFSGWFAVRSLVRRTRPTDDRLRAHFEQLRLRVGIHFPIALRLSDSVTTPALIGWLRPVILIPSAALCELPADYLESLLLHELAHVRRHDYLVNLLQTIAETLLFYHPAAWWVSRVIRIERENCCDDQAIRHADRKVYVKALAMMESFRSDATAHLALTATGGNLLRRIQRLTDSPPTRRSSGAGLLAMLGLLIAVVALSTAYAAEPKPKAKDAPATQPSSTITGPTRGITPDDLVEPKYTTYRIQPGDKVSITVWGLQSPTNSTVWTPTVTDKGLVSVLVVNDPVAISGMTEIEAQNAIARAYKDAQLIEHAMVSVNVIEPRAQSFSIVGGVAHPGRFSITDPRFHLLDAIALAGGTIGEVQKISVLRASPQGGGAGAIDVPAERLLKGDPSCNITIHPRDAIIVLGAVVAGSAPTADAQAKPKSQVSNEPVHAARDAILPEDLKDDSEPDKHVLPGDTVIVRLQIPSKSDPPSFAIFNMSEVVGPSGTVRLDFFHKSFQVAHLTQAELGTFITDEVKAMGYSESSKIVVFFRPPENAIEYTVVGSRLGGKMKTSVRNLRVLEAVMEAKGKNEPRAQRIYILRPDLQHNGAVRHIEIPVDKLLAGDISCNVIVRANDTIVVEPSK